MIDSDDEYLMIGAVAGAHGVRGEVRAIPYTFDIKRFGLLSECFLVTNDIRKTYRVESVKYQKKFVIIKFAGVDGMNGAESLKGSQIVIPRSLALPLADDEYYIGDMIGCAVHGPGGESIGELTDILETGANDVYVVRSRDGRETLIPAVKKYILGVDVAGKKITADIRELT